MRRFGLIAAALAVAGAFADSFAPRDRGVRLGGGGRWGAPRKGSNHARRLERRRVHAARMANRKRT